MFRAAVLCLTFIIAAGPSLSTVCKVRCATQGAEAGCHHGHDGSATRVEKGNSCQDQVQVATTTTKEDMRRRTPSDDVTVWVVTRSMSRAHLSEVRSLDSPPSVRSDQRSLVLTPLRI